MEHLSEHTLISFLLQSLILPIFFPGIYIAYRHLRVPLKQERIKHSLDELGIGWTKEQEGIENVQNLATANIPMLLIATPYSESQIIDWTDQALFLCYTSEKQREMLGKIGIIRASDIVSTAGKESIKDLSSASDISESELRILTRTLKSAFNLDIVIRFRTGGGTRDGRKR